MALTNAERQARFQKRLRERARGADVPERIREALDAAIPIIWERLLREYGDADDVKGMENLYGFSTLDGFKQSIVDESSGNGTPIRQMREWCKAYLDEVEGENAEAFNRVIAIADAVEMLQIPRPKKRGQKR